MIGWQNMKEMQLSMKLPCERKALHFYSNNNEKSEKIFKCGERGTQFDLCFRNIIPDMMQKTH